ncbi:MAG: hypothetical protein O2973_09785 [Gemmatimonadetes bacterium]|nr:hypothetical protein [Gemmatimonadota bacterium]
MSVDISRFHDSAALAVAAAIHLAVPKRRGRPRKSSTKDAATPVVSAGGGVSPESSALRIERALATTHSEAEPSVAGEFIAALMDSGLSCVIAGEVAAVFHGTAKTATTIDIVVSLSGNRAAKLADVLNAFGAHPRGVAIRDAFSFDSSLVRSAAVLMLRARGLAIDVRHSVPRVGDFDQVREAADPVVLAGRTYLVLRPETRRTPTR